MPPPCSSGCSAPARPPAADAFDDWLQGLRRDAAAQGISQATLTAALTGLRPMPDVLDKDRNQPEFTMTFAQYLPKVVSEKRVADGRKLMQQYAPLLKRVAAAYGVQPRFIVALWAVESDYGRVTGDYPVIGVAGDPGLWQQPPGDVPHRGDRRAAGSSITAM